MEMDFGAKEKGFRLCECEGVRERVLAYIYMGRIHSRWNSGRISFDNRNPNWYTNERNQINLPFSHSNMICS